MVKVREHNEYFRIVSLGNRKSCPNCHHKLNGRKIYSWGEYHAVRWYTVQYFCELCFCEVRRRIREHTDPCGCTVNLIGYHNNNLPPWLTLSEEQNNGN